MITLNSPRSSSLGRFPLSKRATKFVAQIESLDAFPRVLLDKTTGEAMEGTSSRAEQRWVHEEPPIPRLHLRIDGSCEPGRFPCGFPCFACKPRLFPSSEVSAASVALDLALVKGQCGMGLDEIANKFMGIARNALRQRLAADRVCR